MTAVVKNPGADSTSDLLIAKDKGKIPGITPAWKKPGNGKGGFLLSLQHIIADKAKLAQEGLRTVQHVLPALIFYPVVVGIASSRQKKLLTKLYPFYRIRLCPLIGF